MARYEQYKDSGIQWIGDIPIHWGVMRLKTCCYLKGRIGWNGLKSEEFESSSYAYLVTGQDFNSSVIQWDNCYQINQRRYEEDVNIQLTNGDLLVTKDGTIGKVAKVSNLDKPACLNSGIFLIRRKKDYFIQGYLYWSLLSSILVEYNRYTQTGATIAHLYQNVFEQMPCLIPPKDEQEAIATYLDSEVSKIDEAIKQQQKMIELLNERRQIIISEAVTKGLNPDVKMKDSGIDWMGQINAEWRIFKLKYLIEKKLMYGANESAEDSNHAHPRYIRITDVNENGGLREETYRSLPPEKARPYLLSQGDILLARSGATAGKSFLFDLDIKACYAGYLIKATPNDKIAPRYLYYYTKSGIYECWCQGIHIQATIQNIGADKYANLPVPLPSLDEQNYIISYLDKKTEEVDKIVTASLDKIAILSKRKRIIINEVVTGKIKIG